MIRRSHARPVHSTRGLALIAVLWVVAALSLMAMGLAGTLRGQLSAAATQQDSVRGQAVAEAAIQLALVALQGEQGRGEISLHTRQVAYQGREIAVTVVPLPGLLPLNTVDAAGLAALLQTAGGVPSGHAQTLAETIVQWRNASAAVAEGNADANADRSAARFEAVEDLLLVPGMDYTLYARIAPFLQASANISSVQPKWAPPELRDVLTAVAAVAAFPPPGSTDFYRLQADVPLDEGKILRLTQDVWLQRDRVRSLPWHILRQDRRMLSPPASQP